MKYWYQFYAQFSQKLSPEGIEKWNIWSGIKTVFMQNWSFIYLGDTEI